MSTIVNSELLHNRLLEMAIAFHKVCVDNGFKYYMLGGTMLGAIRHKGFIPWDDDMDFGMPRDHYDEFIKSANELLPDEYELLFYMNNSDSPMHYAKLIDNRTTLIERNYTTYVEGLYIDIFPLDGAGNGSILDKIHMNQIYLLSDLIIYHCTTKDKRGIKKIIKSIVENYDLTKLHQTLETKMKIRNLKDSNLIANYLGAWGSKEVMPKEIMGEPILYPFENTEFYGVHDADAYLSHLYGDYMKLPPEDKRVFKHNFHYINYNLPFRDFLKSGGNINE